MFQTKAKWPKLLLITSALLLLFTVAAFGAER